MNHQLTRAWRWVLYLGRWLRWNLQGRPTFEEIVESSVLEVGVDEAGDHVVRVVAGEDVAG